MGFSRTLLLCEFDLLDSSGPIVVTGYRTRRKGPGPPITVAGMLLAGVVVWWWWCFRVEWIYTQTNTQPALSLVDQARVRNST